MQGREVKVGTAQAARDESHAGGSLGEEGVGAPGSGQPNVPAPHSATQCAAAPQNCDGPVCVGEVRLSLQDVSKSNVDQNAQQLNKGGTLPNQVQN
jgi:hypothetical protein